MKNFKSLLMVILGMALSFAVLYGMYWIFKTISYTIFYEDMVIQTIQETVKKSCMGVK